MWAPFCENFDMTITKEDIEKYEARQKQKKREKSFKYKFIKAIAKEVIDMTKIEELEKKLNE